MVGEGAVELEVERLDRQRQLRQARPGAEHGRHGVAAHAVTGVDDDLERSDAAQVDQSAQEGGVVAEQVVLADRAGGRALLGADALVQVAAVEAPLGQVGDLAQTGVLTDRPGA